MVWDKNFASSQNLNEAKELAYDLRQGLARRLNEILDTMARARINRNYREWFEVLDCLFIEIAKKLSDDEKEEYRKLVGETNKIIGENSKVYMEGKGDGEKIYIKLKEIDIWLQTKMEDNKMFGSKEDREGLI